MGSVTVSGLGKAYKLYPSRWSKLAEWLYPYSKSRHSQHWVLQDVNFAVAPGEAVGIIGTNGAGKSTLLKIITGTTLPTTGTVQLTGRVSALLELGMGFHPDFTGRQNVFMAGQLLGYSRDEIVRLLPSIEEFAEIGEYVDQPVRVYSSGMQMRLAFSVATAKRPDILIVDEALSVGDAYFQHKSFERIREFQKRGTTLLIVSHDKQAIQTICSRAILLESGRVAMTGEPEAVFDYYNAKLVGDRNQALIQRKSEHGRATTVSGTHEVTIDDVSIRSPAGENMALVGVGQEIEVHLVVNVHQDIDSLVIGCGIKDRLGQMIFGTNTLNTNQELTNLARGESYLFVFQCAAALGVGTYSLSVAAHAANPVAGGKYHWIDNPLVFEVINTTKPPFAGIAWTEMRFQIQSLPLHAGADPAPGESPVGQHGDPREGISVASTKYGPMLVYSNDRFIGESLLARGEFQESKISEVVGYLRTKYAFEARTFIDIGANVGTHLVYAITSGLFQRGIGVEPDPKNYKLLKCNVAINDIEGRVDLHNVALSDRPGTLIMDLSECNYGDHRVVVPGASCCVAVGDEGRRPTIRVRGSTLPELLRSRADALDHCLLWIDTQGHEGHIFRGGGSLLRSGLSSTFAVCEFWPYGLERSGGKRDYLDFLYSCKEVYDINRPDWQAGEPLQPQAIESMYREMLAATTADYHPHTDLLMVL